MTEQQDLLDFPGADALRAAGRVQPPSAQALARARAAVRAAADREAAAAAANEPVGRPVGAGAAAVLPMRRRLASGRRILATALVAAAVAAGVVLTGGGTDGTGGTGAAGTGVSPTAAQPARDVTAATFLDDVATVAAAQPAGAGSYWRTEVKAAEWNGTTYQPSVTTLYMSHDMTIAIVKDGRQVGTKPGLSWGLGPVKLDWKGVERLPTDPAQLLALMNSSSQYPGASVFQQVGTLLGGAPTGPEQRAALFKALARVAGVKVVGTARDGAGRTGTKLVIDDFGVAVDSMIVDPATSTVLETLQSTPGQPDQPLTYLSVGLVDKIGG
ncbi:hypothetical protein [Kitasatospora sp. NPDC057015]|uniref:hypothetical protein n=1 Tax=Kitasatospora sp. NPDC057015 TaxID=3346001 RepID=UPI0036279297